MKPKKAKLNIEYAGKMMGLGIKPAEMVKLLEQARYDAKISGKDIEVLYPAYRQDIMHQRDVLEDILISYGYNNVTPVRPKLATIGGEAEIERICEAVANAFVGMGMQEILSYTLTNKDHLFRRMSMPSGKVVEIDNIVSANWSVFRSWLLPGMMEFLAANKHREYPQKIFEVGDAVLVDGKAETRSRDVRKVAACMSDHKAGYEDIASALHTLMHSLGFVYELKPADHPSFIKGRSAFIFVDGKGVGIMGEVNPAVLNAWEIDNPVIAMELDLSTLFSILAS